MTTQEEFDQYWSTLATPVRWQFTTFAGHPTERNECFVSGFLCGMYLHKGIDRETLSYLMNLVRNVPGSKDLQQMILDKKGKEQC